ncbi:receptor-type tyrosine-protein phosphatase H-like [Cetorhinus maximus]
MTDVHGKNAAAKVSIIPVNTTALKVSWENMSEDFKITFTLENVTSTTNENSSSVIFGGLQQGMNYNVSIGVEYQNCSSNTTQSGTTNPSPVTNLSLVNRTTMGLVISWAVPNDTRVSEYTYNITVTSDTGAFAKTHSTGRGQNMSHVTGLKPGVQYNLTVTSVTPENTWSTPEIVEGTTNPSPVTGLYVVSRTTESLEINWTVPNDTRFSEYTYNITVISDTGNFTQTNSTEKGGSTFNVTGLKPGVQYNLTVTSVTPENTRSTPEIVEGTTNPSPVTGLYVVSRTTESLEINWTVPNDTRFSEYTYNITVISDTGNFTQTNSTEKGGSTFNVTGLKPGVQYNLTVTSVTPENTRSTPEIVEGTTNPSPVTGLYVVSRTTESLKINWTVPNDTRFSEYTYNITVISDTGNFTQTNSTEKGGSTFNVTGLKPGVQYNLTVTSVTPENTRSTPEIVEGTTNPSPVTGLYVVSRTTESLEINWTVPNDTRFSEYTYNITVISDTGNFTQTNSTEKGGSTFNVTGLKPGVQYNLTVTSVTPENTRSTPEIVEGTTNPSPVTGLYVVSRTTESLEINWTVPNDTRFSEYTYNITVISDTGNFTQTNSTEKGGSTFNVTGLKPGVQYNLTVTSVTPENTRSTPEIVEGTTNPSPVTGLYVVSRTTESLKINWTVPNDSRVTKYTYNITVRSDTLNFTQIYSTKKEGFNVTGLKPGVQYNLTVTSVTPENTLSAPEIVKGTTNPSPVTGLSVVSRTTESLKIKWTVPNDTRVSEYMYNITVSSNTGSFTQTHSTEKGGSTFNVTGLKPGVQYNLTVKSVTPENTLSTPEIVKGTTNPSPVTGLSVVSRTTESLKIKWTVPSDTRVSEYTYNITVSSNAGSFTQTHSTEKGGSTFNVTGLKPGVQYNLTVKSVTPENTLSTPEIVKGTTNPSPVTVLSVTNRTTNSLALQWNASSDMRASNYTYRVKAESSNSSKTYHTLPGTTEYQVEHLQPGVQYKLSVQSVTPENTNSTAVSLRDATIPASVTKSHCDWSTGYMITVRWIKPVGNYTGFNISLYDGDQLLKAQTVGRNKTSLPIGNLQPARRYTVHIYTQAGQAYSEMVHLQCRTEASPIIIGAVIGSLLCLILIGLLLFFIITKRVPWRKQQDSDFSPMTIIPRDIKPVPVSEYEDYFQRKHADTDFGFAEEYQNLSMVGAKQSVEAALLVDNKGKNRYTNVLPYDASRIKLIPQLESSTSDYINANYMPGYWSNKEFIAAQGPLPNTVADFWRMIWEQRSKVIVMLTNCVEVTRVKCEHYWPLDYTPCTYGDITVTVTSETIQSEWTVRKFSIKKDGSSEKRSISHFQFTAWPDHGVPNNTEKLIAFHKLIQQHLNRSQHCPAVIHCSAGVGRTGTLIALDYLLQQIEEEGVIDVYGIVHKMRLNRPLMVQTEPQYVFLHQCMLDTVQSKQPQEAIYQNQQDLQKQQDLIYENISAINAAERHCR